MYMQTGLAHSYMNTQTDHLLYIYMYIHPLQDYAFLGPFNAFLLGFLAQEKTILCSLFPFCTKISIHCLFGNRKMVMVFPIEFGISFFFCVVILFLYFILITEIHAYA